MLKAPGAALTETGGVAQVQGTAGTRQLRARGRGTGRSARAHHNDSAGSVYLLAKVLRTLVAPKYFEVLCKTTTAGSMGCGSEKELRP